MSNGMPYNDFLNAVIDDGIEEARATYNQTTQLLKRAGCVAGFEACRAKTQEQLLIVLTQAAKDRELKAKNQASDYWFWRCKEMQIEWVLNVISAANYGNNLPSLTQPTAREMLKALDILGQKEV